MEDKMGNQHTSYLLSRRGLLKASLTGLAFLGTRLFLPDLAFSYSLPDGRIRFYNTHTDERLTVQYRSHSGRYDREALRDINYLLRCNHSNIVHRVDIRLLEFLNYIEKTVGRGKEVHIYSGYRSPSYNQKLVLFEQGAVLNSLHTKGQAIDFSIPGVQLSSIRQAALKMQLGGVGYYRQRGFIHIDCGRPRFW